MCESFEPFRCSICGCQHKIKNSLERQMLEKHGDNKPDSNNRHSALFRETQNLHQYLQTFHSYSKTVLLFPKVSDNPRTYDYNDSSHAKSSSNISLGNITSLSDSTSSITPIPVRQSDIAVAAYEEISDNNSMHYTDAALPGEHTEMILKKLRTPALRSSRVICPECYQIFTHYQCLNNHLHKNHDIEVELEKFTFQSMQAWKLHMENETSSHYVKNCGYKSTARKKFTHYDCNRSYSYEPTAIYRRSNSYKIGVACPSRLGVNIMNTGDVIVTFWKTHVGHDKSFKTLPLSTNLKLEIADKMKQGIADNVIIETVFQEGLLGLKSKRDMLVNKQDLDNIRRKYNLKRSTSRKVKICDKSYSESSPSISMPSHLLFHTYSK